MEKRGIAYILEILKVSPTDLSKFLNVDRTLVSKWKNSSRKLDFTSEYFNKLIDYLVEINSNLGINNLESVFEYTYQVEHLSTDDLIKYLKMFLINNETCDKIFINNTLEVHKITPPVEIYEGYEQMRISLLDLLKYGHSMEKNHPLTFIFIDTLSCYMSDLAFRDSFLKYAFLLLEKGHLIHLVISSFEHADILIYFSKLFLHKNFKLYYYNNLNTKISGISIHILENNRAIFNLVNKYKNKNNPFCAVYNEFLSISSYSGLAEQILDSSEPVFFRYKKNYFLTADDYHNIFNNKKYEYYPQGAAYCFMPVPPYIFMDEKLFCDVFTSSGNAPQELESELNKYRERRQLHFNKMKNNVLIVFISINEIRKLTAQNFIYYSRTKGAAIPSLTFTQVQFKELIKDMIAFFLNTPNFKICLTPDNIIPIFPKIHCWCKENHTFYMYDTENPADLLMSENISFVNSVANLFTQLFLNMPKEMKEKEFVTEFLRNLCL